MERELTVKVNYVLGNQSAFADAGAAAEQVNQKVGKAGDSFVSSMRSKIESSGGILGRLITGGVGTLAGGALFGKIAGLASSEMGMTAAGGMGLRGHGFSGINDSFWSMVTGRGTQEAMTDRTLQEGTHRAERYQINVGGRAAELAARSSVMFADTTEVDPIKRIEEQRAILLKRQMQAQLDYNKVSMNRDVGRAEVEANWKLRGVNTGEDRRAREADLAKIDAVYLEQKKQFAAAELQRATELNNLDKQVFEQRKSMMRESRLHFGSMTMAEQQSVKIAAEQLKAGKDLMPEQVGMLGSVPELKEMLDAYKLKKSQEGGYLDLVAGAKGDMGRAAAMSRAAKAAGVGGDEEQYLESGALYDASAKLKKMLGDALGDVIKEVTTNQAWLTTILQNMMMKRQQVGPRE